MKKIMLGLLVVVSLTLSGCVIVAGDRDGTRGKDSWQVKQRENRQAIAQLQIGALKKDVLNILGEADFSEAFTDKGKNIQVFYFRTQRNRGDDKTTRDETTAVVFVDNVLKGWGANALNKVLNFTQ